MTKSSGYGRQLVPGPTDNSSAARTPISPLHLIPPPARRSFTPFQPGLPPLRAGENDLSRMSPGRPRAFGEVIEVMGRVSDNVGRPLTGVLIELWNANHWGRYAHKDDPARERLDPHFLGYGRCLTDDQGVYRFQTIGPGSYLARPDIGRWRPKHLHFSIRGGWARLITQMYFEGDPHNERDPGFILLGEAQGRHLARPIMPSDPDVARSFAFDIVLRGPRASHFEPH